MTEELDEAYEPFSAILKGLLSIGGELRDEEEGVRSRVYEIEISTPVELDVARDPDGILRIGTTPPMYRVATTFQPSFHHITIGAHINEGIESGS